MKGCRTQSYDERINESTNVAFGCMSIMSIMRRGVLGWRHPDDTLLTWNIDDVWGIIIYATYSCRSARNPMQFSLHSCLPICTAPSQQLLVASSQTIADLTTCIFSISTTFRLPGKKYRVAALARYRTPDALVFSPPGSLIALTWSTYALLAPLVLLSRLLGDVQADSGESWTCRTGTLH